MLHFLDLEGTRNYKADTVKHRLSSLLPKRYTQQHWEKSRGFTEDYAVYTPLRVEG